MLSTAIAIAIYLKNEFLRLSFEGQHPFGAEEVRAVLLKELFHKIVEKIHVQAALQGEPQRTDLHTPMARARREISKSASSTLLFGRRETNRDIYISHAKKRRQDRVDLRGNGLAGWMCLH